MRSRSSRVAALLLALGTLALVAPEALAQAPTPGSLTSSAQGGVAGAELGFGQLNEDFFLNFNINLTFRLPAPKLLCEETEGKSCVTQTAVGLRVPLRLRVIDRAPQDKETLRKEDWDEVSDYFKIVRFIEYGIPSDPIHARLGELSGVTVGHGTAMNRYFNVLNIDHFQLGFHGNYNHKVGGVQVVVDNLLEPEVLGGRTYVRPWSILDPSSWWVRYAVGMSLLLDVDAPREFERVNVQDNPATPYKVDKHNHLIPSSSEITGVLGIDQEIFLVQEELVDFIPYMDLNFHLDGSPGLHLGALTNLRPADALDFHSRLELRWLGENYIPDYFSSLYEIERDAYFGFGGQGQPKLIVLEGLDRGSLVGAYGEATLDIKGAFVLTAAYEDYQGPDNASLLLRAQLPSVGSLHLGAMYRKIGFDDLDEAFNPENALLVAEARYHVLPFLYLLTQYSRLWRLKDEEARSEEGSPYETVDDWFVGAGISVGF